MSNSDKYLPRDSFVPQGEELEPGQWIRVNHDSPDCTGDSQSIKIERKMNGNLTAYCFRCGKRGFDSKDVVRYHKLKEASTRGRRGYIIPNDCDYRSREWPPKVRSQVSRYGLEDKDYSNFRIGYSPSLRRLVLPVFDKEGLAFYQTKRMFDDDENKAKYVTYRNRDAAMVINTLNSDTIVIVEDLISAIKCGKLIASIPLFGNCISDIQLNAIRNYKKFIIFMDDDNRLVKLNQQKICQELNQFGKCRIITGVNKDPKECSLSQLEELLL